MSNTSKVVFKLDVLKQRAVEAVDEKIEHAKIQYDLVSDKSTIRVAQATWRERQDSAARDLAANLDNLADKDLIDFRFEPYPEFDEFQAKRAARVLDLLVEQRASVIAKAESLVPDADGNIALTQTQLKNFFGLG